MGTWISFPLPMFFLEHNITLKMEICPPVPPPEFQLRHGKMPPVPPPEYQARHGKMPPVPPFLLSVNTLLCRKQKKIEQKQTFPNCNLDVNRNSSRSTYYSTGVYGLVFTGSILTYINILHIIDLILISCDVGNIDTIFYRGFQNVVVFGRRVD